MLISSPSCINLYTWLASAPTVNSRHISTIWLCLDAVTRAFPSSDALVDAAIVSNQHSAAAFNRGMRPLMMRPNQVVRRWPEASRGPDIWREFDSSKTDALFNCSISFDMGSCKSKPQVVNDSKGEAFICILLIRLITGCSMQMLSKNMGI